MKAAIAISGLIIAVVAGLLVMQRREQVDLPTDATRDDRLVQASLAVDLPDMFLPAQGVEDAPGFPELLALCDEVGPVLTGGAEEDRIEHSAVLAEALLDSLTAGPYDDGFIDDRIDASGVFADPLRRQFRQLAIALETHWRQLLEDGNAARADVIARAGFELGRRVFEQNVRLRGRQRGLGLMHAGLGQMREPNERLRNIAAISRDGVTSEQWAIARAEEMDHWAGALAAIESAWKARLATISSAKPNVADLVRVAELDRDRSFRVFATHQLGFARFERGEPGNQRLLAEAIGRARASDDPLVRAAGEAAASMTREQFHTRER